MRNMQKRVWSFMLAVFLVLIVPDVMADAAQVGIYVLNLGKFEVATGSFTADFYLSMKCSQPCAVENFEFVNGRAVSVDKIIDLPDEKFYRIQANLNSPINLKRFPFDQQEIQVIIEDKKSTIDELAYVPDVSETGLDEAIVFPGWKINGWNATVREHKYGIYNETYAQYIFSVQIARIGLNAFIKTFLPILFIMLVVLSSFIIDPDKVAQRLTMAGSSLVAAVMFHISITNQIPPTGYLTIADKIMMLTYFILLVTFVINIILLELGELKRTELVERIHRRTEYSMFVFVPLIYILAFWILI